MDGRGQLHIASSRIFLQRVQNPAVEFIQRE
jgi:hypothetical protein